MGKKIIGCLLLIIFFNCCKSKSEQIDSIWENLIHAKNIEQENDYSVELQDFLSKKHISFQVYFIDRMRITKGIELKKNLDTIKSITIEFDIDKDRQLIKKGWKPKDMENCYYLFLE